MTPNIDSKHFRPFASVTLRQAPPLEQRCKHGARYYSGEHPLFLVALYCPHKCKLAISGAVKAHQDSIAEAAERLTSGWQK